MKIYWIVCNKYRKFKNPKTSHNFKKALNLLLFTVSVVIDKKKIFKKEESNEILKILDLITIVEEYQKISNNVWRKYKNLDWKI